VLARAGAQIMEGLESHRYVVIESPTFEQGGMFHLPGI
jgi:hypothetical protein